MLHIIYTILEMINYFLLFYLLFDIQPARKFYRYIIFLILIICSHFIIPASGDNDFFVFFILGILLSFFLLCNIHIINLALFICVSIVDNILTLFFVYSIAIINNLEFDTIATAMPYAVFCNSATTISLIIAVAYRHKRNIDTPLVVFSHNYQYILLALSLFLADGLIGVLQGLPRYIASSSFILNLLSLFVDIVLLSFFFLWLSLSHAYMKQLFHQHEEELAKQRISDQEKHFELIKHNDETLRKFRHDMRSHMSILNELLSNGLYKEAQEYLSSIGAAFNSADILSFTNIASVDAVISHYMQQMKYNNINFQWNYPVKTSECYASPFELCIIFDNLLSNALQACINTNNDSTSNSGTIQTICVDISVKNSHWHIKQTNPVSKPVVINKAGLPISTKSDKSQHGFGCQNIQTIVSKHNGTLQYSQKDNIFKVDIVI